MIKEYVEQKLKEFTTQSPIATNVDHSTQEFVYGIKIVDNCPIQGAFTEDCGIHIYHIMDRLCNDEAIEGSLTPAEVKQYKVKMIKNFTKKFIEDNIKKTY